MSDETSRAVLTEYAARHGAEPRLGCSLVSHRDLGMCSACKSPHDGQRVGADRELAAWRLLAMAERGIPRQPWETPPSDPSQTSASVDALPADRAATPTAHPCRQPIPSRVRSDRTRRASRMRSVTWDRLEPVELCTSPDGHEHINVMSPASTIPARVLCPRCGAAWHVVVMPAGQ